MATFKTILFLLLASCAFGYVPPPGIPDPATSTIGGLTPFGFEIDRATPAWPASWTAGTPSATAGYYYVDKTAVGATNTSNPYGHPGLPRLTPPGGTITQAAGGGALIYVHAGTYTVNDIGSPWQIGGVATSAAPIWVTGNAAAKPQFQMALHCGYQDASFIVIEHLNLNWANLSGTDRYGYIDVRPVFSGVTVDHVLVRNCTMTGKLDYFSGGGIGIGGSSSDAGTIDFNVESVVVYNCLIHTIGAPTTENSEQCGIYKAGRSKGVWALNNTIYGVGADCIAGTHGGDETDNRSEWYFIGGNNLANPNSALITCGENSIDLKSQRYVVVSSNYCRGPYGREQGWGIVFHSSSTPVAVRDAWFIFNTIHHASSGIVSTSTNGARDAGFVGNLIYDIKDVYAAVDSRGDPWNGSGIRHMLSLGTNNFIVDNTIYDYEDGIVVQNLGAGDTCVISGNILNNLTDAAGFDYDIEANMTYATSNYNVWPASPRIRWGATTYTSLASWQSASSKGANDIAADPVFVNTATQDFSLQTSSPAKNASVEGAAYAAFEAIFGINIEVDKTNTARPLATVWDMGAYEFGSGAGVGDGTGTGTGLTPVDDPPTLSSATIPTGGTTLVLAFNEAVTPGAGGSTGWALSLSSGSVTATYASGAGTSSLTYNLSGTVYSGTTGTVSYTQPGNGIEDGTGNDLTTLTGFSITNNSTQGGGGGGGSITTGALNVTILNVGG